MAQLLTARHTFCNGLTCSHFRSTAIPRRLDKTLRRLMARVRGERWRALSTTTAVLAECPRWSRDGNSVYWIDIPTGVLHQTDVGERTTRSWKVGREIAAMVIDADVGTWAWVDGSIRHIDSDGRTIAKIGSIPGLDDATSRANDAAWAPDGSLWISTMSRDGLAARGGVVRYAPSTGFATLTTGIAIGNGPVFDSARNVAYIADSAQRLVLRCRLASPFHLEPFIALSEHEGYPDGMAVDQRGNLWVAHFGAGRISVWTPMGMRLLTVETPCDCPTALALEQREQGVRVAVTSAATATEAGGLWSLTMPWAG